MLNIVLAFFCCGVRKYYNATPTKASFSFHIHHFCRVKGTFVAYRTRVEQQRADI